MRIISKFHDYYDVGQKMGMDQSVIFAREMIKVEEDETPICCQFDDKTGIYDSFDFEIIGFCGKIIPFIVFSKDRTMKKDYLSLFSIDQIPEKQMKNYDKIKRFLEKKNFKIQKNQFRYANNRHLDRLRLTDLFQHFKVPIFYIYSHSYENKLVLNPCLKTLGFYRYMNPITAYQEIFRFVANDLADAKDKNTIFSDKIIAASKGFGHKYAFKQEPGVKTRKGHAKRKR